MYIEVDDMEGKKKPGLKELLKDRNRDIARRSNAPRPPPVPQKPLPLPQRTAQPEVEKPLAADRDSIPSEDINTREFEQKEEKPEAKQEKEKPKVTISRIPNRGLETKIIESLRFILEKDPALRNTFAKKHIGIDENQNILIGKKIIGKYMGGFARIYFHMLWQGNIHGKLELFTNNNLFSISTRGKYIFFRVEEKNTYLAYSDTEGGKEGPFKMAL